MAETPLCLFLYPVRYPVRKGEPMQFREYGNENRETILLLHGGGLSWWNYRDAAAQLSADYHVILPILDGHADSDAAFSSIEDNAARILSFIDAELDGSVALIGGVSLGGQVLLEILSQRKDVCRHALIESTCVIPSALTRRLIKPVFGSCYGLIGQKWFAKLQFRYYRLRQDLFEPYYRDTCRIAKADMIAFLEENASYALKSSIAESCAKAHIFVGERETRAMRKSADRIHAVLCGSTLQVLPKLHHGAFSVNCAENYAATVKRILQNA